MTFTYVDLFSGIGGFCTALNRIGGTCVMASEIDTYANRAYRLLYGVDTVGDVTKIDADSVPDHDVLVGGFPCQPFTITRPELRRGLDDTRGTLFFEIARIAEAKQPQYILLENVKGLLSDNKGQTWRTMLDVLEDIGYSVDYNVLNSKFYGVPQSRERVYIVAARQDRHIPLDWNVHNGRVDCHLIDFIDDDVDERFYMADERCTDLLRQLESGDVVNEWSDDIRVMGRIALNGHDLMKRVYDTYGMAPTLHTVPGGNTEPKIAVYVDGRWRIRKITPRESMRLQGFPDTYYKTLVDAGFSNSRIYKFAGNAVTVNVIEAIGKKIAECVLTHDTVHSIMTSRDNT